jgi:lysophospholipase L1-like esterase
MTRTTRAIPRIAMLAVLVAACSAHAASTAWVASWATSQQVPEARNALPDEALANTTLRQTVHVSLGGKSWRLRLSNAFGTAPLRVSAAHVARPLAAGSPKIDAATDTAVLFDGRAEVVIPAGADYVSDAFRFEAANGANIAISLFLPAAPRGQTSHPGSRTTSHWARGNQVSAAELQDANAFEHWFVIAGMEVEAKAGTSAIAILGDSIADGRGSTTNQNDRWSDVLAARITAAKLPLAVLNHGIGGNRLLDDGLGPNALARLDRDVLGQAGVRYLIVHEGINDLGTFGTQPGPPRPDAEHENLVRRMTGAYRQIIERAHARGIKVIGCTLMPYAGPTYHPTPRDEEDRRQVNEWIRTAGHFDAVVDFDKVVRDPADPLQFRAEFDSGDHLHPSPAGFRAMAGAFPLALFRSPLR